MKKTLILCGLAVCTVLVTGLAQSPDSQKVVKELGVKIHQGFVLIHSRHLRPIRNSYPTGIELDFAWQQTSKKAWESCHCYPKMGIATSFWDYDNPQVLGQGITGLFYLEPVFGAQNTVSFSIRAGFGLSYQNKPYDEETNPDNLSYSTYVAFPLQLGGSLHFRLKPQWYLDVTAVYNHFSNAGIREPNKGINWPTAALGVGYYLERPNFKDRKKINWRDEQDPETRFDVTVFAAFNEPKSKTYLVSPGLELKYSRQVSRLSALTAGGEWIYDNGSRYEIAEAGRTDDPQRGSLAVGHEFLLGKFLFSQQIGVYLYKPYDAGDDLYQRYGLVYRVTPHLSGGINLKAHRHVADFLDVRVGYSF